MADHDPTPATPIETPPEGGGRPRTRTIDPARRRRVRRRGDDGFTFVEVVITVVLVGVVVLPILTAVQATIRASSVSRAAAEVETVLLNAADRVSRADRDDFNCDLSGPAEQAAIVQGAPWSAANVSLTYEHWDGAQFVPGACPGGVYQNGLVQLIRIRVTGPEGGITRELEVVKSDI